MSEQQRAVQDRRGLRFPFDADAEAFLDNPPQKIPVRLTELSFRGCYLETSISLPLKQRLRLKLYHANEYFEALADVIYVRPNGVGALFIGLDHHSRGVLQNWILAELDKQAKSERP